MENPYFEPDVWRYQAELLEIVNADGLTLANDLENGIRTAIPEGVTAWLILHTAAVNGKGLGEVCHEIAKELEPPHLDHLGFQLAKHIRHAVNAGQESAQRLKDTENRLLRMFGKQDQPDAKN